jgi:hypothetical protein
VGSIFNVAVTRYSVDHDDVFGTKGIAFTAASGACVLHSRTSSFAFNPSNGILPSTYMLDDRDIVSNGPPFSIYAANETMYCATIET